MDKTFAFKRYKVGDRVALLSLARCSTFAAYVTNLLPLSGKNAVVGTNACPSSPSRFRVFRFVLAGF